MPDPVPDASPSPGAAGETALEVSGRPPSRRIWATPLLCGICVAVFLGIATQAEPVSWESMARWGYVSPDAIWRGAVWGLVTSTFVHVEIWHVAFNVYWLWVIGTLMERALGPVRFLLFYLASAFISSGVEMATGVTTGIGASGVVYALFGFVWVVRGRYPGFAEFLDGGAPAASGPSPGRRPATQFRPAPLFLAWLVLCIVTTYTGIWRVGNAAHVSGLMFGTAMGAFFVLKQVRVLAGAALAALLLGSTIPLFWCPWSETWLSVKAFRAHERHDFGGAVEWYDRILRGRSGNAWALWNRGLAREAMGQREGAEADFRKARELDPSMGR